MANGCNRITKNTVMEWDGYFLIRNDTKIRQRKEGDVVIPGFKQETYELFKLEPYSRMHIYVGGLEWAINEANDLVEDEDD